MALGRGNTRYVHDLVATAFHGLPKPGQEVRHLDDDRDHNAEENLKWGTRGENIQDRKWNSGAANQKLSGHDGAALKLGIAAGDRGVDLAVEFGVSPQLVSHVKHGRCHVR